MNTENKNGLVIILDAIGRTILGECSSEKSTEETLAIKNPVILHVVDTGGGRMSIQLLPLFFREFMADKTGDVVFSYKKNNITLSDIDALDFRLQAQYSQMFNKNNNYVTPEQQPQQQIQQQPTEPSQSVINLFDE